MIKKLRVKFICVIMAIVMLLMGIILGVVVHFTSRSMEQQSIGMMRTVATTPFQREKLGRSTKRVRLPFLMVQIDRQGNLLNTVSGYFELTNEEYIQEIVDAALSEQDESGRLKEHNLRYLKNKSPKGYTIVFADMTTETTTLRNLVMASGVIFLTAAVLFLGISILLSRWVIRPVEEAWDQQRQFVADASHELKTPLTVIMANAELMQNEDAEEGEKGIFARNILTMTYQMRSLVENLLEMARADSEALKMKVERVDFSQLVEDAVLSFQLLFEERGLGLQCTVQEEICIQGSEQHLYQVMDVLLDNALKYSTPNGTVRVTLNQFGQNCVMAVSSPGEPISKEDLKNIFKRFYRVDKARAMNGSYGLGLSIAESIVVAHKGKIWAKSKDGYNSFYVQLPSSGKGQQSRVKPNNG